MEEPRDLSRLPDKKIDKALLARYRKDASAFTAIYERFSPVLLVFITSHLEGVLRSDAEDILHETFLAFHRMRERLQAKTKLRGLLYRIADRRLTDHLRAALAQKRDLRETDHPDQWNGSGHFYGGNENQQRDNRMAGHIADPKADPTVRDAKMEVDERMAQLPATEAQAVRLVELDGHTHASAAELVKVPESTIWSRVRSGRKHLQEMATATT